MVKKIEFEVKNCQQVTSYIKQLTVSGLLSISAPIKGTCNLTGKCFEMPNVSYCHPLAPIATSHANENKLNL